MTSTLTDLERKLVELERELGTVASGVGGDLISPEPLPVAPTAAETRVASLRVEDLRGEIAELVRFRDQLESAARDLVSEYDRLVARLQGAAPPAPAAPAPPEPAAPAPAPAPPAPTATGLPPSHAPGPQAGEDTVYEGAVTVDAGPFRDITTLQTFEQALARVDGAQDVYVRAFEGDRAHIDVRLSNPVPLVQLLRQQLALPMIAREAGEGRLTVDVAVDSHGT